MYLPEPPRNVLGDMRDTINNAAGATGVNHNCPQHAGACSHRPRMLGQQAANAMAWPGPRHLHSAAGLASGRPGSQLLPRPEPVSLPDCGGRSRFHRALRGRVAGRASHPSPHFEEGAAEAERARDQLNSHKRSKRRPRTTFLESNGSSR